MTTAREEAEDRFPDIEGLPVAITASHRDAFVLGAEWQAKQPVEITYDMVERLSDELARKGHYVSDSFCRELLSATLGGSDE